MRTVRTSTMWQTADHDERVRTGAGRTAEGARAVDRRPPAPRGGAGRVAAADREVRRGRETDVGGDRRTRQMISGGPPGGAEAAQAACSRHADGDPASEQCVT